jgi:tetratricopeptide (TPR) repeat protein
MLTRWDETWHRLSNWTNGQAPSERLAVQVLYQSGYEAIDPSHPLGGPDGAKDAVMQRGGEKWIMAAYFPRGQQSFSAIKAKLASDYLGVGKHKALGLAFITNQEISIGERRILSETVSGALDLYHLERVVSILDMPMMASVRTQFLQIDPAAPRSPVIVTALSLATAGVPDIAARTDEKALFEKFLNTSGQTATDGKILILTGLPGSGKSTLADWACRSASSKNQVYRSLIVDMRGYDIDESPVIADQVFASALRAMGVTDISADLGQQGTQYHQALDWAAEREERLLLLLDNVFSVEQVRPLLPRSPFHRVVITSRESLAAELQNATSMRIGPLANPDAADLLLRDSERASNQGVVPSEFAALAAVCGNLPLALRICAAILKSDARLDVRDLIEELKEENDRLEGLEYGNLAVRASIKMSVARLSSAELLHFKYASAHPSAEFSTEAVTHMMADKHVATARALRRLRDRHLLEDARDTNRWRMHDLVRLYSRELSAVQEAPEARREAQERLVEFYADIVEDAAGWIDGSVESQYAQAKSRLSALAWMHQELANLVGSAFLAKSLGHTVAAWRVGMSLVPILDIQRNLAVALRVLAVATDAAEQEDDQVKLSKALNNIGLTLTSLDRLDEATKTFQRAIRAASSGCSLEDQAVAWLGLSAVYRQTFGTGAALHALERARKLRQEAGDFRGMGYVLTNIGITLGECGRYEEAIPNLRSALEFHRTNRSRRAEASTLTNLATALHQVGNTKEAIPLFEEAIKAYRDVQDLAGVAMTQMNFGNLHVSWGDLDKALDLYKEALVLFEKVGHVAGQHQVSHNMAAAHLRQSHPEAAKEYERRRLSSGGHSFARSPSPM